jgi:hypothetical protein
MEYEQTIFYSPRAALPSPSAEFVPFLPVDRKLRICIQFRNYWCPRWVWTVSIQDIFAPFTLWSVCGSLNDLYWREDTAEMKPAELILPTNFFPLIWELCTLKLTVFHHRLCSLAVDLHPEMDGSPCDRPHLCQILLNHSSTSPPITS